MKSFARVFLLAVFALAAVADTLPVCIQIRSVHRLASDLELLCRALNVPSPAAEMLTQLGRRCGVADLTGIDTNRGCVFCVVMPEMAGQPAAPTPVLALPLMDKAESYFAALTRAYAETNGTAGVRRFVRQAGADPLLPAEHWVAATSGVVVIGSTPGAVQTVAERVGRGDLPRGSKAVAGTVKIIADLPALAPHVAQALNMAQQFTPQPPAGANQPVDVQKLFAVYRDYIPAAMKQVQSLSLALAVKGDGLEISTSLSPVPGTTVDRMCRCLKPVNPQYEAMLPPDALLAEAGTGLNALDELIGPYCDFVERVMRAVGTAPPEVWTSFRTIVPKMKGLYAGDYAFGVVASPDGKRAGLVEILALTDPARWRAINAEFKALYASDPPAAAMGVTYVTNAPRRHGDIVVESYTLKLEPQLMQPQGATPLQAPLPPGLTQFTIEEAVVGNDMVMVWGGSEIMDATLDRMRARGAGGRAKLFTTLFPQTAGEPVTVTTLRLVAGLRALLSILPNSNPALAAAIPETGTGIAGYTTLLANNEVFSVARVPLAEITGVKNAIPVVIGALTQAMMAPSTLSRPGGEDPRAVCISNLRLLREAKQQAAAAGKLATGTNIDSAALLKYLPGGVMPKCPPGGTYTISPVGRDPTCSVAGHSLSWEAE